MKRHTNGAANGLIHSSVRLSIALRYFAGGSVYDIALVHGVSHTEVYQSIWRVLNAINQHSDFDFRKSELIDLSVIQKERSMLTHSVIQFVSNIDDTNLDETVTV